MFTDGIRCVPGCRDVRRRETNSRLRPLKSLPRKLMKKWSMCHCSLHLSPPGTHSVTRNTAVWVKQSIVSFTPSIAASAVPPYSIATVGVSSKFGVLGGKFIKKEYGCKPRRPVWPEEHAFREFRRAEDRGLPMAEVFSASLGVH